MDADGDGTVSLQEWQAAHERIFKAMDADHDGTVTLEEMEAFMDGHQQGRSACAKRVRARRASLLCPIRWRKEPCDSQ